MDEYAKQAQNGKLWCYDCIEFVQEGSFCGYCACRCKKYGSLDQDQKERHPDRTADTCPDYKQKAGARWFEQGKPSAEANIFYGFNDFTDEVQPVLKGK